MESNKKYWIVRKLGKSGRLLIPENIVRELQGRYVVITFRPIEEVIDISKLGRESG